jgi:AraC-like DNA-binding protein
MLRPYDLLENVLIDIEKGIGEGVNLNTLAEKYGITVRHLHRLFKFAFKQSLGGYIRSRKLAASLDDLLKTDYRILDIALDYGFDYEQSYLATFKREFGITPGNFRKSGLVVKTKPPLHQFHIIAGLHVADSIEAKYGAEVRNKIFGDIDVVSLNHDSLCKFFHKFVSEMDKLDDKEFLTGVMAECCPCYHRDLEENIRKNYAESRTLEEFARRLDEDGIFDDTIKLDGNILIATKRPFEKHGKHDHTGPYTTTCHCELASHAQQKVSDIFCHCCTVGFYGKMFKNALKQDVKVEFVESVITGGKRCTAAIHLPEKGN